MTKKARNLLLLVLLFSFFSVLESHRLYDTGKYIHLKTQTIADGTYRRQFFSPEMKQMEKLLSPSCRLFLQKVEKDSKYFPIPTSTKDSSLQVSYVNSWMAEREYKGTSGHEGTDLMASKNERGIYPILSISDGTVTSLGWLEKGGYRVGITSPEGVYYYYAHLDSYAGIHKGEKVKAGQLLGFMGDSGYGPEGTTGQFAVHLHLGIYSWDTGEEISVNPYYVLQALEKHRLKYSYS